MFFLPTFEDLQNKKSIYFIFLEDVKSFITFSGFLKWVFKHNKATKPWMEMNLKSLLLSGTCWNFLITLLLSFQGGTAGLPNVIFGFQAWAEVSGWGFFIMKCISAVCLLKRDQGQNKQREWWLSCLPEACRKSFELLLHLPQFYSSEHLWAHPFRWL